MSTHFRTLLLGFTCVTAVALGGTGLTGCFVETGGRGDPVACAENQYFNVQWEIDNGTQTAPLPPLQCNQAPPSHVELTTNAGTVLQVGKSCADGNYYNFLGSTVSAIPVGTAVTIARLLSDSAPGAVLSTATAAAPLVAIGKCLAVQLSFEFPLGQ